MVFGWLRRRVAGNEQQDGHSGGNEGQPAEEVTAASDAFLVGADQVDADEAHETTSLHSADDGQDDIDKVSACSAEGEAQKAQEAAADLPGQDESTPADEEFQSPEKFASPAHANKDVDDQVKLVEEEFHSPPKDTSPTKAEAAANKPAEAETPKTVPAQTEAAVQDAAKPKPESKKLSKKQAAMQAQAASRAAAKKEAKPPETKKAPEKDAVATDVVEGDAAATPTKTPSQKEVGQPAEKGAKKDAKAAEKSKTSKDAKPKDAEATKAPKKAAAAADVAEGESAATPTKTSSQKENGQPAEKGAKKDAKAAEKNKASKDAKPKDAVSKAKAAAKKNSKKQGKVAEAEEATDSKDGKVEAQVEETAESKAAKSIDENPAPLPDEISPQQDEANKQCVATSELPVDSSSSKQDVVKPEGELPQESQAVEKESRKSSKGKSGKEAAGKPKPLAKKAPKKQGKALEKEKSSENKADDAKEDSTVIPDDAAAVANNNTNDTQNSSATREAAVANVDESDESDFGFDNERFFSIKDLLHRGLSSALKVGSAKWEPAMPVALEVLLESSRHRGTEARSLLQALHSARSCLATVSADAPAFLERLGELLHDAEATKVVQQQPGCPADDKLGIDESIRLRFGPVRLPLSTVLQVADGLHLEELMVFMAANKSVSVAVNTKLRYTLTLVRAMRLVALGPELARQLSVELDLDSDSDTCSTVASSR